LKVPSVVLNDAEVVVCDGEVGEQVRLVRLPPNCSFQQRDGVVVLAQVCTVAGEKKWSESRTSGTTHPAYGAGRISTAVSTRHEFWLVAPDGEEKCVELGNSKVSVRDNQVLTAIWGARVGLNSGPFLLLCNHNAQGHNWLISDDSSLLKRMGLSNPFTKWTLMGLCAAVVVFVLVRGPGALPICLLATAGGMIYGFMQRKAKARALREAASEVVNLELSSHRNASSTLEGSDPLLPA